MLLFTVVRIRGPSNFICRYLMSFGNNAPVSTGKLEKLPLIWALIAFGLIFVLLLYVFQDGLEYMVAKWEQEEYSHGYMIPLVALLLIAQRAPVLQQEEFKGSWLGTWLFLAGFCLFVIGELSSLFTLLHYGFLTCIVGAILALTGLNVGRHIWAALLYLVFMIPLPNFLYFNLSSELQLISSSIGVAVIRLFDISVFLEGNVIDLGSMKLQVVEACSGLRYLFPLMSFGFLIAYLFKAPLWQRALIFLSTIPITVLMNSFRIAVIGITVNVWGKSAAEGFLHDFEGWIVFMSCLALLTFEIWLLHKITNKQCSLLDQIDLTIPSLEEIKPLGSKLQSANWPLLICLLITLLAVPVKHTAEKRVEDIPDRLMFTTLPLFKGPWMGRESHLETQIAEALKVSDYIVADYSHSDGGPTINFYIAYYNSQRKGASIHSPRSCIPGGGWQITSFDQRELHNLTAIDGSPLRINRAIIEKGEYRSLVYYWFQQRGRIITNEYLAKWYLFWDSLTKNRTDGALIRLVAQVPDTTDINEIDKKFAQFLEDFNPLLPSYIPN